MKVYFPLNSPLMKEDRDRQFHGQGEYENLRFDLNMGNIWIYMPEWWTENSWKNRRSTHAWNKDAHNTNTSFYTIQTFYFSYTIILSGAHYWLPQKNPPAP